MRLHHAALLLAFLPFATPAYAYGTYEVPTAYSAPPWASWQRNRPFTGYEPYWHAKRHAVRVGYRRTPKTHQRSSYAHYGHIGHSSRHGRNIPGPCYEAARKGGPCGCTAESIIFGTTAHVLNGLNLWLARTWHVFETATPAPGMAAIWGNHHVEAIVSSVHNGHFTTSGPYGHREVRVGSVRVVNPRSRRHFAGI